MTSLPVMVLSLKVLPHHFFANILPRYLSVSLFTLIEIKLNSVTNSAGDICIYAQVTARYSADTRVFGCRFSRRLSFFHLITSAARLYSSSLSVHRRCFTPHHLLFFIFCQMISETGLIPRPTPSSSSHVNLSVSLYS